MWRTATSPTASDFQNGPAPDPRPNDHTLAGPIEKSVPGFDEAIGNGAVDILAESMQESDVAGSIHAEEGAVGMVVRGGAAFPSVEAIP